MDYNFDVECSINPVTRHLLPELTLEFFLPHRMFHIGTLLTLTLVLVLHSNLVWSEPSSSNTEDASKDTDGIEIIDSIESELSSDTIDTEPPEDTGGPSFNNY